MWKIYRSYLYGMIGSTILIFLAYNFSSYINSFHYFTKETIKLIQVLSLIPGAATLYAQHGWEIQTWSGESKEEILNRRLFNIFSAISLFLAIFGQLLKP